MNILFYYPSNLRTNVLESQMIHLQRQGHKVFLLTITDKGHLHEYLEQQGINTFSQNIKAKTRLLFYAKSRQHLIRFAQQHQINVMYCHLQQANFIGVLAQSRLKNTKIITCRHHHDRVQKGSSWNARFFDRVINRKAKAIVAPSRMVYEQITIAEKVDPKKVFLIPYTYDFSLFPKPDLTTAQELRKQFPHRLLAITLTRLVDGKGLMENIQVVRQLVDRKIDFGLVIAGDGELKPKLEEEIRKNGLEKHVYLTGHVYNTMDYIAACDFMLLLSDNEASNNAVKEAAHCGKTSIVCANVGDFDDYIVHGQNGFFVPLDKKVEKTTELVEKINQGEWNLNEMGQKLKETVHNSFSIEKIIITYNKFHQ